jgi:DNA-binding transcriptional LysR family regulator
LDQLAAMRLFTAIADAGSLSGAGRRLGLPLSTVSRQLAGLEGHLGTRLVTRTTRRLGLTEHGRLYLDACRRILEEVDSAAARISGEKSEPEGELALTAPIVFGRLHVLPVVAEFLGDYPQVNVRMLLLDRPVDLIEEGLDVAVRIGTLADSSLIATRVGSVRYVLCASPDYLERRGTPKTLEALAGHDCITFSSLHQRHQWIFRAGRKEERVSITTRLSVNTAEAAIDAAVAGVGITRVLSYQAAHALADGSLRRVLPQLASDEIPVTLLHREGRLPQRKVQSFIAFAGARLRRRLGNLARVSKRP